MNVRFLLGAVVLAVLTSPVVAAPPQITFNPPSYDVAITPGASVAYLYAVGGPKGAGVITDTDGDGRISIDVGVMTLPENRGIVVVDMTSGEFASSSYAPITGNESRGILRGPTGGHTELVLERSEALVLWVRPGIGAWTPAGSILEDRDGSSTNRHVIGSIAEFQPLGSSPERPSTFVHGDLFFSIGTLGQPRGGLVNAALDAAPYAGALTFLFEGLNRSSSVVEGNDVVFTILRLYGSDGTSTVRCCVDRFNNGSAVPGLDFVPVDMLVTFAPGELVKRVTIRTINDAVWARGRALAAELSDNPYILRPAWQIVGIQDDDPKPVVGIEGLPETFTETDGEVSITVGITVTGARRGSLTVNYESTDNRSTGRLTFLPEDSRQDVVLKIPGDDVAKPDYRFAISAEVPETDQRLGDSMKVVDDERPTLAIDEKGAQEGTGVQLNVLIAPWRPDGTQFKWTTVDGTARAGQDYVAASGTYPLSHWSLGFLPDDVVEGDETFYVDISEVVGGVVPVTTRIAITIFDDDGLPPPQFSRLSTVEGNGYGYQQAPARLTLPAPLAFPITYQIVTELRTATWQTDFNSLDGPITFQAGQTEADLFVQIIRDEYAEEDETFTFTVAGTNSTAVYTIIDDDSAPMPSMSIADATVVEGTGANRTAFVVVTLSAAVQFPVRAELTTVPRTAKTDLDFGPRLEWIGFGAGETTRTIAFAIIADGIVEEDEQFTVRLSNPAGAVLTRSVATVTIIDDDSAPSPGRKRAVRH